MSTKLSPTQIRVLQHAQSGDVRFSFGRWRDMCTHETVTKTVESLIGRDLVYAKMFSIPRLVPTDAGVAALEAVDAR